MYDSCTGAAAPERTSLSQKQTTEAEAKGITHGLYAYRVSRLRVLVFGFLYNWFQIQKSHAGGNPVEYSTYFIHRFSLSMFRKCATFEAWVQARFRTLEDLVPTNVPVWPTCPLVFPTERILCIPNLDELFSAKLHNATETQTHQSKTHTLHMRDYRFYSNMGLNASVPRVWRN